jgi:hypothetical protein
MKCDIPVAYFQETHFDQNIENEINFNTYFNVYGSIGTSASRGVAIFINPYHAELYTQDITCMLNCFEEISQNLAFFLSLLCS